MCRRVCVCVCVRFMFVLVLVLVLVFVIFLCDLTCSNDVTMSQFHVLTMLSESFPKVGSRAVE